MRSESAPRALFRHPAAIVAAVAFVLLVALGHTARRMWRGDVFSGALLAGLCGFLLVGITESPFDGPRVMVLFFLVLFMALRPPRPVDGADAGVPVRPASPPA